MSERVFNILDMPDEMLVEIILHLNARERSILGNSCRRFKRLVFEEKKLLRYLDFSREGFLTSMSNVQQYFNNKNKYLYIHKINVSNIYCTRPAQMLQSIDKAKNLVEVNIIGLNFKDCTDLGHFLMPLENLKKLSVNWPAAPVSYLGWHMLTGAFSKLTHLKILLCDVKNIKTLIRLFKLCQELEELFIVQKNEHSSAFIMEENWLTYLERLKKLKVAACHGIDTELLRSMILHMLPDTQHFDMFKSRSTAQGCNFEIAFFIERNSKNFHYIPDIQSSQAGICQPLTFEYLLKKVIQNKNPSVSTDFCCLSKSTNQYLCSLSIQDTKLLLKNPKHQISSLYLNHDIEPECDIHFIALAFPRLTKLVLSNIIKSRASLPIKSTLNISVGFKRKRIALEKDSAAPAPNFSFQKLVENTPCLKDLTVCASELKADESWDLLALDLIAGWERLTSLYLAHLPIRTGQFLVKIGKHCPNLEKLRLENLGPRGACCYVTDLSRMLSHTHNLKDFSIQQNNLGQVSHLFTTLAKNLKLRRVCVQSLGRGNSVDNLLLSIHKVVQFCSLILLVCEIEGMTRTACDKFRSKLQTLKDHLHRPNFQFEMIWRNGSDVTSRNFNLHSVHRDLLLPHCLTDAFLPMDCL